MFETPLSSSAASFDSRALFRPLLVVSTKRLDAAALGSLAPTLASLFQYRYKTRGKNRGEKTEKEISKFS